jgi:anti-sigma-K factor RskA
MIDGGHIEEQVAARALGALPADEAELVDRHADGCPSCKELLLTALESASLLAFAAQPVQPPRHCKARLMERVGREEFLAGPTRHSARPLSILQWAVTAAAFIALFGWNLRLHSSVRTAQIIQDTVAADPDPSMLKSEGSGDTPAVARMFMAPNGEDAVLIVHNLKPAPPGKVYQIWVVNDEHQQPMDTFQIKHEIEKVLVHARVPMRSYKWVMITLEEAGGSTVPSPQKVLVGDL